MECALLSCFLAFWSSASYRRLCSSSFLGYSVIYAPVGPVAALGLAQITEPVRRTAFSLALHVLLKLLTRQIVAFLPKWLDQESEQATGYTRRTKGGTEKGKRPSRSQ